MAGSSSQIVRAAVASYITGAAITNLAQVYADPPFDTGNIPWATVLPAGVATNAIGVVWIDQHEDTMVAFDGAGGRRVVTYDLSLELLLVDVSGDPAAAQNAMDAMVDAVVGRLRTDPAMGTDQTTSFIIQGAVGQLRVERGRPIRPGSGNGWGCWTGVRFQVQTYEYST